MGKAILMETCTSAPLIIVLIDSANQKCIDKIESLQERILRIIEYEPVSTNLKVSKTLQ